MAKEVILAEQTLAFTQDGVGTTIVLKDRNGNDVTYNGIETVTFDTPEDGVQATFTLGVEQTGKEVELDFSGGDQVVKADDRRLLKELTIKKPEALLPENIRNGINVGGVDGSFIGDTEETTVELSMVDGDQVIKPSADGKVLSKVVINKPETLIPENIAEGIDIAGVVGNFAGGGSNIQMTCGLIDGNGGVLTVNHNLGVIPDLVIFGHLDIAGIKNTVNFAIGFSDACIESLGISCGNAYVCNVSPYYVNQGRPINLQTSGPYIHNVTNNNFSVGSTQYRTDNLFAKYYWFAFYGLT